MRRCGVAIAKGDDAGDMRSLGSEGGNGRCNVGGACFESAIFAFTVANAASVITKDRITKRSEMRGQRRLSGMGPAADFVTAADDQQPGGGIAFVECRCAPSALAGEACHPPHDALHAAKSVAIAADIAGSSCGSARSQSGLPMMSCPNARRVSTGKSRASRTPVAPPYPDRRYCPPAQLGRTSRPQEVRPRSWPCPLPCHRQCGCGSWF